MIHYQNENIPVHQWKIDSQDDMALPIRENKVDYNVGHLMSTDIYTVNEDTSLDFVEHIMNWNNIHHLPVENHQGNLIGIITDGILKKSKDSDKNVKYASDLMITNFISVNRDSSITKLKAILLQHKLSGLPVVYNEKLIGMITTNDIKNKT